MKSSLILAALAVTAFCGFVEMGVMPAQSNLLDLDSFQADQPVPSKKCDPNEEFRIDCNTCLCSVDGLDYACSRKECGKPNVRKRSLKTLDMVPNGSRRDLDVSRDFKFR